MEINKRWVTAKNITIAVISILIGLVVIGIFLYFNLYEELGYVLSITFNIISFSGILGMLEIDDWTIWYKRWIIKKYNLKKGKLEFKIYDSDLNKKWISIPFKQLRYYVTNDQDLVWRMELAKDQIDTNFYILEGSINPITKSFTITDSNGKKYKLGKDQYYYNGSRLDIAIEEFNFWIKNYITANRILTINPDSFTIVLEK